MTRLGGARRLAPLLLGLLAIGGSTGAAAAADAIVVEGKRVVVRSTVPSKAVAERCRDALEAALAVYERDLPYRMPQGERLVVHLYARAEEYAAAVTEGGAGALARNLAATLRGTKESHVVLQPRADPSYLALVGDLPELTRFLVCHEGVHQFLRRAAAPGIDLWPDWYAEGMADLLASECLQEGAPKDAPPPIHVDDKRAWVAEALARDRALGLERLLFTDQFAIADKHGVYAHWEELYRLLAADPARLLRLHEGIRGLGLPGTPAEGARDERSMIHARACAEVLAKVYGPVATLEEALRKQTRATRPTWFEHVRASERVGDEIVCAGFPGNNAILISAAPPPGKPWTLSGEVNLLDLGARQADLYLGFDRRADPRLVKLALGAAGYVSLMVHSDGFWQDRLATNASVPLDTLPTGTWVALRLRVDRERIRLELGGKAVFDAPVPPGFDVLGGAWGLGATDGVARFRKMVVAPGAK